MSRKKRAPKKIPIVDPKYKSSIIPKLINSIMYDGKKTIAEKIIYDAIDKIKSKSKDEPITVFNEAINNIRPTVEVRSRKFLSCLIMIDEENVMKHAQDNDIPFSNFESLCKSEEIVTLIDDEVNKVN